ncbi:hypothetical protein QW180_20540 [Vibrio sinaloensis]|nr:hypothetical protein [Vibrio sinaloensis]
MSLVPSMTTEKLRLYGAAFYNIFENFIDVKVTGYDDQRLVAIQTYEKP